MPRFLAILIMYLLVLGVLSFLIYLIVTTAIAQVGSLSHFVQTFLPPQVSISPHRLNKTLHSIGISQEQISSFSTQLTNRLETVANDVVPVVSGVFSAILDIVLVAVLSIYLLSDGARAFSWMRQNLPRWHGPTWFWTLSSASLAVTFEGSLSCRLSLGCWWEWECLSFMCHMRSFWE